MQAQEDKEEEQKEDLESWGQHKQEQDKLDEQRGLGGLVISVKNTSVKISTSYMDSLLSWGGIFGRFGAQL